MLMKNKIVALLSVLIISSSANAFAYATGDYHEVASQEEYDVMLQGWEETKQKHNNDMVRSEFLENKIQAPLIKYNKDKLKKAKSPYEDGLYQVYIADTKKPHEINNGGECLLTYIYLTQGLINQNSPTSDYNIYGLSAIASVYAHESGHWYYNDVYANNNQKDTNEIRKMQEGRADKFALQLIDNVPNFSVGGHLIYHYYGTNSDTSIYPSKSERLSYAYDYIKNASNGRVYFENDKYSNHLLVSDAKEQYEFEVYPPRQYNPQVILNEVSQEVKTTLATAESRAFYVSGSISWAIKHGAWNKNSVSFEDAHKYFEDLPKNVNATVIIARSNSSYKIIDWFLSDEYLTAKQAEELNNYLEMLKASYQQ